MPYAEEVDALVGFSAGVGEGEAEGAEGVETEVFVFGAEGDG